jgi:hypothetical protein
MALEAPSRLWQEKAYQTFWARLLSHWPTSAPHHEGAGTEGTWRLVLSKPFKNQLPAGDAGALRQLEIRPLWHKQAWALQAVWHHATRDITKLIPLQDLQTLFQAHWGSVFMHAHFLHCRDGAQLLFSKKGVVSLVASAQAVMAEQGEVITSHNRIKQRWIDVQAPFLHALGVTDASHAVVPSMSRKWKQINKFVEIYACAHERAVWPQAFTQGRPLRVVDFGSGKAYLTFALHAYLQGLGLPCEVQGVELRAELVRQCELVADRVGASGLSFVQGDVHKHPLQPMDVMVALHACDEATDLAIHAGIQGQAQIIVCSPCCHKQIRPQLLSPHPLRPVLQHGIHLGQQAEMLTDALRALLLETQGYEAQIFEFVSLEHTSKNKMILAVRRAQALNPERRQALWEQVQQIKQHFGVKEHCLETLIRTFRQV